MLTNEKVNCSFKTEKKKNENTVKLRFLTSLCESKIGSRNRSSENSVFDWVEEIEEEALLVQIIGSFEKLNRRFEKSGRFYCNFIPDFENEYGKYI